MEPLPVFDALNRVWSSREHLLSELSLGAHGLWRCEELFEISCAKVLSRCFASLSRWSDAVHGETNDSNWD